MDIHPSAFAAGLTRQGIYQAVENALITTHIGNAPTQIFMLGEDETGQLLEISAVVRHEDVFVFHAAKARSGYMTLADVPDAPAPSDADRLGGGGHYGKAADGMELTENLIQELFVTAERGYDVERLSKRTRPGRPAPITVGRVVRVGLNIPLRAAVASRADDEGVEAAELIEQMLRAYLVTLAAV